MYTSHSSLLSGNCITKQHNSELVCVLMKSFCLPIIVLYGLEVTDPKKSVFAMLDNFVSILSVTCDISEQ